MSLETHLEKASSDVRDAYDAIDRALGDCGAYRSVPTKTQITLLADTSFGTITIRRRWINLGFMLDRELTDPRIIRALHHSAKRYAHTVRVSTAADVDAQLQEWLRESYALGVRGSAPRSAGFHAARNRK